MLYLAKRLAERRRDNLSQTKEKKTQVKLKLNFITEEDWDAIRAKLEVNAELTKDVLGKDLPEQDFAKRMVDLVNQRKKHFAEERAKAKRNKPMTWSQLENFILEVSSVKRCLLSDAENEAFGWKMKEVCYKLLKMIEKQAGVKK
ncbi:hypothetical protein Tco_0644832 [Tanacetum coccineum]